jgi:hypothetical protein
MEYTREIVFHIAALDIYIWGVTIYGVDWQYMLTNIELELDDKEK